MPDGPFDAKMVGDLEEAFGREHEKTYGHRAGPDEPVELVAIQIVGQGLRESSHVSGHLIHAAALTEPSLPRQVYFGSGHGWLETPILRRADLQTERAGPTIIEEYDATCVIPPGARARLDAGNIIITLG
jgi:N-methylhydantoinase A